MADLQDDIDVEALPVVLREMCGAIGLEATLVVVRHFGGTRLWVPKIMRPEHALVRLIGWEAAVKLSAQFGDLQAHFDIPRATGLMRALRNREIRRKRALGKSRRELAREHQTTERHIDRILGAEPEDELQESLFR